MTGAHNEHPHMPGSPPPDMPPSPFGMPASLNGTPESGGAFATGANAEASPVTLSRPIGVGDATESPVLDVPQAAINARNKPKKTVRPIAAVLSRSTLDTTLRNRHSSSRMSDAKKPDTSGAGAPNPENPPNPTDDLRKGLGLLFRAAKTVVADLPTGKLEEAILNGVRDVGRAVENVATSIEREVLGKNRDHATVPTTSGVAPTAAQENGDGAATAGEASPPSSRDEGRGGSNVDAPVTADSNAAPATATKEGTPDTNASVGVNTK